MDKTPAAVKAVARKSSKPATPAAHEKNILVLQGGGALGSYQAGAYAALSEAGYEPEWLAGISIGSINSAIIAGNQRQHRVEKLREFWHMVSSGFQAVPLIPGELGRTVFNESSAFFASIMGVEGFFQPRVPFSVLNPFRPQNFVSYYDSAPLKKTLENLVDFDYLNDGKIRFSAGAVNVRTGNFAYFDSRTTRIGPEHVMASGALPPGLPPVEIDGEFYWDGGLVSNTPLQYVMDNLAKTEDSCIFQVDLYSAAGELPHNILDVAQRESDIRYSSRTRLNTNVFKEVQTMKRAIKTLLEKIPDELKADPDYAQLLEWSCDRAVTIVHFINRRKSYQTSSKDYEFSRVSMDEHWLAGVEDVSHTLNSEKWKRRTRPKSGVKTFDLGKTDEQK